MKATLHSHHTPTLRLSKEVGSTPWPDNIWGMSYQSSFFGGYNNLTFSSHWLFPKYGPSSFPLLWKPRKMSHSGRCNATNLPCRGSKFSTTCFCVSGVPLHQYTFISYHKLHILICCMQQWTQSCYLHF